MLESVSSAVEPPAMSAWLPNLFERPRVVVLIGLLFPRRSKPAVRSLTELVLFRKVPLGSSGLFVVALDTL